MRLRAVSVLVFAIGISACAAISGLGPYGDGDQSSEAALQAHDADAPDSLTDDGAMVDEAGDDGSVDPAAEAGLAADARPVCSPSSCPNGCCNAEGNCTSGASLETCGTGGETCNVCSSTQVCKSGACAAAPVVDSGPAAPPACVASSCGKCGIAQQTCCKSDHVTCGCTYFGSPCQ
jgi:hypothetical protein